MKKLIILSAIVSGLGLFRAQALTASENYIYSKTYLSEDGSKKAESVQYFDGLGRLKQTVSVKSTPSGKDLVVPSYYDELGRQAKDYLPLPMTTANSGIQTLSETDINTYYGVSNAYSEKIFENSPLDRVVEVAAPGDAWKKASGHTIRSSYETNVSSDQVKKYTITSSWANATLSFSIPSVGWFGDNQLMKNVTRDEDGNQSIQFKNSQGQLLLARKMDGSVPIDTYYVYNLYNQLVLVIPPKANAEITQNNNVVTQEILDQLCYQYKYDNKNRLVEKRLPGKDFWEYLVYDRQNRLVLSQDANQHLKEWSFIKYDRLGRTAYTGLFASTSDRIALQNALNAAPILNNETRTTASLAVNGENMYYTNNAFPTDRLTVLTINYYDEYAPETPSKPAAIFGKATLGSTPAQFSSAGIVSYRSTKGMPTSSSVKNIENDAWTKTHIWYDTMGRSIGSHTINHLGGYTKTETELDFAGVILQTRTLHKRLAGDSEKTILQNFEYDSQNRMKKQWHKVGSLPQELLAEYTYNDLSRPTNKKVGSNLQSIDYTYDIHGTVTKVNNPANLGTQLFGYELKYFNPQNTNSATGLYNGNITEIDWKTASDNVLRRYNYQYDALNRLKKGIYSEPDTSVPQNDFYNETVSYDGAGNISSLQRTGKGGSGMKEQIDDLSYTYTGNRLQTVTDGSGNYGGYPDTSGTPIIYDNNGNMTNHEDKGIVNIRYNHLNLPGEIKFNVTYTVRNPDTGQGEIKNVRTNYIYSADGTKLRKKYTNYSVKFASERTTTTDYLDGFQYTVNHLGAVTLDFVPTSEGYYDFKNNRYIYSYTDHLGNIRLSYFRNTTSGSAEVLEENNYYPFGMKHTGYNALAGNPSYLYQYNGKELQEETGWNDYGARFYMPDLGRWGVVDPMAEVTPDLSPYHYANNNPLMYNDPTGMLSMSFMNQLSSSSHGTTWYNTGSGFTNNWGGSMDYDGNVINWSGGYTNSLLAGIGAAPATKYMDSGGGYSIQNNILWWWTNPTVIHQAGTANMLKLRNENFPSNKEITPWQLGVEWLSGNGPRHRDFTNGDLMTEMLRQHSHVQNTRDIILSRIAAGQTSLEGSNSYKLGGIRGVGLYLKDYSTLLTGGLTGNLAVTYLGSYNLEYTATTYNNTVVVTFNVENSSTMQSASRPPVLGYLPIWQHTAGKLINEKFKTGWGSKTTQSFNWKEILYLK